VNTSNQIKELNDRIEDLQKQISELVTAQQDRTWRWPMTGSARRRPRASARPGRNASGARRR